MFSNQLRKILELAKKTGDRVVIFDGNDPENSYVISGIDSYLKEDRNEEKVDIKRNHLSDEDDDLIKQLETSKEPVFTSEKENQESLTEEDLTDRINQEISMWKNQNKSSDLSEEDKVKKSWKIPPAVKNKAHNIE